MTEKEKRIQQGVEICRMANDHSLIFFVILGLKKRVKEFTEDDWSNPGRHDRCAL